MHDWLGFCFKDMPSMKQIPKPLKSAALFGAFRFFKRFRQDTQSEMSGCLAAHATNSILMTDSTACTLWREESRLRDQQEESSEASTNKEKTSAVAGDRCTSVFEAYRSSQNSPSTFLSDEK